MRHVRVGHYQALVADFGYHAGCGSSVHRGAFAYGGVIADYRCGVLPGKFQVLGYSPHHRARENPATSPQPAPIKYHRMRSYPGAISYLHIASYVGEGFYYHPFTQAGFRVYVS